MTGFKIFMLTTGIINIAIGVIGMVLGFRALHTADRRPDGED